MFVFKAVLCYFNLHFAPYLTSSQSFFLPPEHKADTPQFRGGNPYFFRENLYQTVSFVDASMYRDTFHTISISMQFGKKSRHCVGLIKMDSQRQRLGVAEPKIGPVEIGALRHVADIGQ